jgi:hypothetical protein
MSNVLQDFKMTQLEQQQLATTTADNRRQLLTVPGTAAYLGLSEYSVRKMVRDGQLPTRQVAKRQMVPVALLRDWLGGSDERTRVCA